MDGQPDVLVVDPLKLRRAAMLCLISDWAMERQLAAAMADLTPPLEKVLSSVRLVFLSVGGASVDLPDIQAFSRAVTSRSPQTSLVVASDLETPHEVMAAFLAGARAFLPTSIEPKLAKQVLGFVLDGGSFFPPHLLLHRQTPETLSAAASPNEAAQDSRACAQAARRSVLTARQQQVAHLLRRGMSNKVIARELSMTEATVKVHVRQIMRKLGATNRTQAALSSIDPVRVLQPAAACPPAAARPAAQVRN